jgi:predicted CXXCH cytochrome family protein
MSRRRWLTVLFVALGSSAVLLLAVPGAQAKPSQQKTSNDTCLACHGKPGITLTLDDNEVIQLSMDPATFAGSVHGQQGFACTQCHTTLGDYPHPKFHAADRRDFALQLYRACQSCHQNEYERTLDSVHERARAAGITQAALCTDCHGAHDTRRLTDPQTHSLLADARTWIPQTCAKCHSAIYDKYLTSVHGSALEGQGNPDVPTCIDCHGVHNIPDPTTAAFRLKSPQLCARCHTDNALMAKYGISTQVLNTYVADFHGTTVTLFEKQSPDAVTNKPVCFDCHGVHDIQRVDDPQKGLSLRQNLLVRCQRCHPQATADFPEAWLSHYIPSPQRSPLVYTVNLFYKIFIPGTLGGMAVIVLLDASWRIRSRIRKGKGATAPPPPATPPASPPAPRLESGSAPAHDIQPDDSGVNPAPTPVPGEAASAQGIQPDSSAVNATPAPVPGDAAPAQDIPPVSGPVEPTPAPVPGEAAPAQGIQPDQSGVNPMPAPVPEDKAEEHKDD